MRSPGSTLGAAALGAKLIAENPGLKKRNESSRVSRLRRATKEQREREAEAAAWIEQVKRRKRED